MVDCVRVLTPKNDLQAAVQRRQLLTGRPGQRPNRWVAWEDVRSCLLGWKGYNVIEVSQQ